MNKRFSSGVALLLLAVLFLAIMIVSNAMFGGARVDLTERKLYTLSDGTKNLLGKLDEPINLYFFFSDEASQGLPHIRTYASRVQEMLEEFVEHSNGKLNLDVINPEPFSEEEDRATGFGLAGVPVQGNTLYFGLAGTNAVGDETAVPFFQAEKGQFLEYDLSKMIYELANPEKPVIGLISGLPLTGAPPVQPGAPAQEPWMIYAQLTQFFDVRDLGSNPDSIDPEIEVLLVVHPKELTDVTLYAIDQFVLSGGNLALAVDPLSERDQGDPLTGGGERSSNLNKVSATWGLTMPIGKVVGDREHALQVQIDRNLPPVSHLGLIQLGPDYMTQDEIVVRELPSLVFGSPGHWEIQTVEGVEIVPLVESSADSRLFDASQFTFLPDPRKLLENYVPTEEQYLLAARIGGKAQSAFDSTPEDAKAREGGHIASSDNINVIAIADTDLLSDRLWVQIQNFLGQRVANPWSGNADFLVNALDNLGGGEDLIGIRSRAGFNRPFDLVQELRRDAESKFRDKEEALQARLRETEQKVSELQQGKDDSAMLSLTPEQQEALLEFQQEKLQVRKELREVQHQLDKDIDRLGSWLQAINVIAVPLILVLIAMIAYLRRAKARVV